MNPAILNTPLTQLALPIVLTLFIAAWLNGRGLDGINTRIDDVRGELKDVNHRLDRVDETLKTYGQKI